MQGKNLKSVQLLVRKESVQLALWALPLTYVLIAGKVSQLVSAAGLITTFFLALMSGLWVWLLWRNGSQQLATPLDVGLATVLIALILSAVFSLDPSRSWRMVWNWLAPIVAFYAAVVFFRNGAKTETFLKSYFVIFAVLIASGYWEIGGWVWRWVQVFGFEVFPPSIPRLSGFTNSPNILAVLLNVGIFLAVTYRTAREDHWPLAARLLFWLALPILILTGSRSALLGTLLGGSTLYLAHRWVNSSDKRLSWRSILTTLSGMMLAGLLVLIIIAIIRPTTLELNASTGILYRSNFWAVAWRMWQANPIVGKGLDTFGSFYMLLTPNVPPRFPFRAAHSWWFSLLAEAGIVGMGAALLCWAQLGRFLWCKRSSKRLGLESIGVAAALMAFTVHSIFDTPEPWVLLVAALLLAVLIFQLDKPKVFKNRPHSRLPLIWIPVWVGLLAGSAVQWRAMQSYEAGLAAAEMSQWEAAVEQFGRAQAQLPYLDSSFLLASGLSYGILANQDEGHLSKAVQTFEELISLEPGWPTNHANLAALYWQSEERELAIATMGKAAELAPEIPLYHLNLGLWYEALGNETAAKRAYEQLYPLDVTWYEASLWERDDLSEIVEKALPAADEIAALTAARVSLTNASYEEAAQHYAAILETDPYKSEAYIGLGIAQAFLGDEAAAVLSFDRAILLGNSGLPTLWKQLLSGHAWESLTADFQNHTTFGVTVGNAHVYPITTLNRLNLPYDLLPQLSCFSLTDRLYENLVLMQRWAENERGPSEGVEMMQLQEGNLGKGVASCSAPVFSPSIHSH